MGNIESSNKLNWAVLCKTWWTLTIAANDHNVALALPSTQKHY